MILGMPTAAFTMLHVIISLVAILAGAVVVLYGMPNSRTTPRWTVLFLATSVLTCVSGFLFPTDQVLPSQVVGVICLVVLAAAVAALYKGRLAGAWRWIYVVAVTVSLYLNVFVAVIQAFLKIPSLHAMAPTQQEPPFLLAQGITLVLFIAIGVVGVKRFHPGAQGLAP